MARLIRLAGLGVWLGASIFGGVAAAHPVIRERAGELGDIRTEEVDGLYALAVFLPGLSFLNLWGAVGARVAGVTGALVAVASLLAPAAAIALLLPVAARLPLASGDVAGMLYGAIWATVGLLAATGLGQVRKLKSAPARLLCGVGLAALLLGLHPLLLLGLVMGAGALAAWVRDRRRDASAVRGGEGR